MAGTTTIAELLLAYVTFACGYYVDAHGVPTKEFVCMKYAIRPVRELYCECEAADFGPLALRAVRKKMNESRLCRTEVNHKINRIKRVFRWAVSEQLIPV